MASAPGVDPSASAVPEQAVLDEIPKFPRDIAIEGGVVTVYEPQAEAYEGDQKLTVWLAAVVNDTVKGDVVYGSLKVRSDVHANLEDRTVTVYNRSLIESYFPDVRSTRAEDLARRVGAAVSREPSTFPLDVLLAYLSERQVDTQSVDVSMEPPTIFHSMEPAALLMFDGDPVFAPVGDPKAEGAVMFAVNTNWTVLREKDGETLYALHGESWLSADNPMGPWVQADAVPQSFGTLPDHANWEEVRKALPARTPATAAAPRIYATTAPAELIVTDGSPQLGDIKGTGLAVVINTTADLFLHRKTNAYYYLVSGRWFRASALKGPWQAAGQLPDGFSMIPEDHSRAHVRSSVPGTMEARFAVMQAQIPTKAEVPREGLTVEVTYLGEPKFEAIENTSIARAVNTPFDVIKVDGRYLLVHEGVWFVAAEPTGPWTVTDTVPSEVYDIPVTSPAHHVTYVHVYESTPSHVYVGYTAGYHHHYVSYSVSVYGSGFYWSPYTYYYDPFYYPYWPYYPVYYAYPYTYGFGAYYNSATGTYGRGGTVYGPYGGMGRGATYNPTTGRYSRGVSAWGPSGGGYARQAYNPRTGVYSETIQSANSYSSWGESYVRRGDDWISTSRATDARGTLAGFETSAGGRGVGASDGERRAGVVRAGDGDLYAGAGGNVFRRSDEGWQRREGGEWQPVERNPDGRLAGLPNSALTAEQRNTFNQRYNDPNRAKRIDRDSSSIDRLNRDAKARNYGNQRYDQFRSSGAQRGNRFQRRGGFRQ